MSGDTSKRRRWTIYRGADTVDEDGNRWEFETIATPALRSGEEVEVIPVAEYERLREAAQWVVEADAWSVRGAIEELREILESLKNS